MTALEYGYVSSSLAKEVAQLRRRRDGHAAGAGRRGARASECGPAHAYNPAPRRVAATDIIFLVERLESLVAAGKKLPLTNNVVLDQATVLELIDQLRVAVPEEVRQARRITEESGRITERAREEGDAIVARAQEQAAQMLEERELVRAAQQRAAEILDQAQDEAREVRRGADEYAAGVLIRLEGECIKALTSIKRGIDMLDERHRADERRRRHATPRRRCDRRRSAGEGAGRPAAVTAFNVAGLLHEPPGATREIRLRDHYTTLGPDVELAGPIDADLRLQRTNRGILLRGELAATCSTTTTATCSSRSSAGAPTAATARTAWPQALREDGWQLELPEQAKDDRPVGRPHLAQAVLEHPANAERLRRRGPRRTTPRCSRPT